MEDSTRTILLPSEVIDLIFDQMEAKGKDESLAAFANLARSCRAFTEPALNRLWRVQGKLTLLIRCMPEDLWEIVLDEDGEEAELTFRRPIVETDWNRFNYYQWRVRELGFTYDILRTCLDTCDVHTDVLRALTTYQPAKVFLPNLQRWTADYDEKELLPFVDAFIGPKLKHVVLNLCRLGRDPQTDIYTPTALSSLARLSVDLQYLEIKSRIADSLYDLLFNIVMHLPNLRHLVVPPIIIHSKALDYLSRLPFLEVLSEVELLDGCYVSLFNTQNGRFPSLKELSICAANYTPVLALLEVLQRPLQSVSIEVLEGHLIDNSTLVSYFKQTLSILERYHRFSLRKLVIDIHPALGADLSGQAMSDVFAPLFSLQSLQYLRLRTPFTMHLDDVWLAHAATSWPSLNTLTLVDLGETQGVPAFTLKGLIPLIKGCPHLSELNIPLNLKPVAVSFFRGVSNWHIKQIFLTQGSSLVHPQEAFRSLITMFPNLIRLDYDRNSPSIMETDWQEFEDIFQRSWPVDREDD